MDAYYYIDRGRLRDLLSYNPETGEFVWVADRPGHLAGKVAGSIVHGHIRIGVEGKSYYAHRLAWLHEYGKWPNGKIDHINGNKTDNRISNLRDACLTINNQNLRQARVNNKSGLLGVMTYKSRRQFGARITVNRKAKFLGYFDTPEEAHEAYLAAKRRLHEGCTI